MSSPAGRALSSAVVTSLALATLAAGCLQNEGTTPPPGRLNFPVAIALLDATDDAIAAPTHLVVVNANSDLGYNSATLQSYDLAAVETAITTDCVGGAVSGEFCSIVAEESGEASGTRGNVTVVAEPGLLASEVRIGSNADGIAVSPDGHKLYIPVRADSDITTVAFDTSGRFDCGNATDGGECDDAHRRTDRSLAAGRDLRYPIEPLDIHAGSLTDFGMPVGSGEYLAVAHRTGQASFFAIPTGASQPILTDVLTVTNATFVTTTFDPVAKRFWFPTGNSSVFVRASVSLSSSSTDATMAEFQRAPSVALAHIDLGSSTPSIRQVFLDPRIGTMHEGRIYGVALRPSELVVGRIDAGSNSLALDAVLPLGTQPTRAKFLELGGRMLAFVSCYLSRDVYIYDVDNARLITIVRGMSGPFEIAIDETRERLFVDDYRVSVVRMFDLANLIDCLNITSAPATEPSCAPTPLGMLGIPSTVEELR